MYNWSTDTTRLKKYPEKYDVWKLEQMINFGLNGEKIDITKLRKYWKKLDIEPLKRKCLQILFNV